MGAPMTAERFFARTQAEGSCLVWQGQTDRYGYGRSSVTVNGRRESRAYRVSYFLTYGTMPPKGLEIDHLCRNRKCVNPVHLALVTKAVNWLRGNSFTAQHARKTHCDHGHPFDEANTYWMPSRGRMMRTCRTCNRAAAARYRARRLAK